MVGHNPAFMMSLQLTKMDHTRTYYQDNNYILSLHTACALIKVFKESVLLQVVIGQVACLICADLFCLRPDLILRLHFQDACSQALPFQKTSLPTSMETPLPNSQQSL